MGVEVEAESVIVRFAPRRGHPAEIEDRIRVAPHGEMSAVYGVGRLLRILRAARVRAPEDPYSSCADPERAAELLMKCRGTIVDLHVARRYDRGLTLWTESGVERIGGVVDYVETSDALQVRRRGGRSVMHIAKDSLIRYELTSEEFYEVTSIEAAAPFPLR